jgi:hypothetical protein
MEATALKLVVDLSAAAGLASPELVVLGRGVFGLDAGRTTIVLSDVRPGSEVVVLLRGAAPGGMGTKFTVLVEPNVNGHDLVGFACRFEAAQPDAVIASVLDTGAAAFSDLLEVAHAATAAPLLAAVGALMQTPPSLPELAEALAALDSSSLAGDPVLADPAIALFEPVDALARWQAAAAAFAAGQVSPEALIQAFGDIGRRLETAISLLL